MRILEEIMNTVRARGSQETNPEILASFTAAALKEAKNAVDNGRVHQPVNCRHCGKDLRLEACHCPGASEDATPCHGQGELRAVRLWHWRQLLDGRRVELALERMGADPHAAHQASNFHLRAVQSLNEFFAIGDTAERDHES